MEHSETAELWRIGQRHAALTERGLIRYEGESDANIAEMPQGLQGSGEALEHKGGLRLNENRLTKSELVEYVWS